jgi:predicted HNH restriction endonuclease
MGEKFSKLVYEAYMVSPEWRDKKRLFFKQLSKDGRFYCDSCKRTADEVRKSGEFLNVHHVSYLHFGNEPFDDLELLCISCHKRFHREKKRRKVHSRSVATSTKYGRIQKRRSLEQDLLT